MRLPEVTQYEYLKESFECSYRNFRVGHALPWKQIKLHRTIKKSSWNKFLLESFLASQHTKIVEIKFPYQKLTQLLNNKGL